MRLSSGGAPLPDQNEAPVSQTLHCFSRQLEVAALRRHPFGAEFVFQRKNQSPQLIVAVGCRVRHLDPLQVCLATPPSHRSPGSRASARMPPRAWPPLPWTPPSCRPAVRRPARTSGPRQPSRRRRLSFRAATLRFVDHRAPFSVPRSPLRQASRHSHRRSTRLGFSQRSSGRI